jgi:hypothetical protein
MIVKRCISSQVLFDTLVPVAEQRCEERERAKLGQAIPKHVSAPFFSSPIIYPTTHRETQ